MAASTSANVAYEQCLTKKLCACLKVNSTGRLCVFIMLSTCSRQINENKTKYVGMLWVGREGRKNEGGGETESERLYGENSVVNTQKNFNPNRCRNFAQKVRSKPVRANMCVCASVCIFVCVRVCLSVCICEEKSAFCSRTSAR